MANVSSSNSQGVHAPSLRFPEFSDEWTLFRLGDIYTERKESGNESLGILTVSIHSGVSNGELDEESLGKRVKRSEDKSTYKKANTGDLVFNMMRAWQGAIGTVRTSGMVSPAYIVAIPNDMVDPEFMDYYVKTRKMINHIHRLSYGVTDFRLRLYWESFVDLQVRIPSLTEQAKLAHFLTILDKRIRKQKEYVNALKSYKRGLIFSIFKSNNKYRIEMELVPMRALLEEYRIRETDGLRVCSVAVEKGVVDQVEHLGRSFAAADTSKYGRVEPNYVVYTKSPTGDFPYGIVKQNTLTETVAVSPLYGVYKPRTPEDGTLLHFYFEQHENANNYIRPLAQKGAKNTINITTDKFLDKDILFPKRVTDIHRLIRLFEVIDNSIRAQDRLLDFLNNERSTLLSQMFI